MKLTHIIETQKTGMVSCPNCYIFYKIFRLDLTVSKICLIWIRYWLAAYDPFETFGYEFKILYSGHLQSSTINPLL